MSWCSDCKTQCVCTTTPEMLFGAIPLCRALALTPALHRGVGCRVGGFRGMRLKLSQMALAALGWELWSAGSGAVLLCSMCCMPLQG